VIQHHPYSSGTDFRREFVRRFAHNGSIPFGSWSLRQTRSGSVHLLNNDVLPTFEAHGVKIETVLSHHGREFYGRPDQHPI